MRNCIRTAIAVLAWSTALVAPGLPPAGANTNGSWALEPVTANPGNPRSHFLFQAFPEQTIADSVRLSNLTDQPMTFRLYPADAFNTSPDGAFSLRQESDPKGDVGAWVTLLGPQQVTVPGGGKLDVPFNLSVPRSAAPGDHAGGIVALNLAAGQTQSGNVSVNLLSAVGVRIYLRVNGAVETGLDISDVRMQVHRPLLPFLGVAKATVTYTVRNIGNVRVSPSVTVRVRGSVGGSAASAPRVASELLPGGTATVTEKLDGFVALGRVRAEVVAAAEAEALREARATSAIEAPWLLLAVVAVAVVAVLFVRRRRRSPAPAPAPAEAGR